VKRSLRPTRNNRHAASLLIVSEALSARRAMRRCAAPPHLSVRGVRSVAEFRCRQI
jgi:hypothetical protein